MSVDLDRYYDESYPPSLWQSGVTNVAPATAIVGAAPFTLTVTGTGFTDDSVVSFDGDARPTTFVSETQLTANVASPVGPARTVAVTVSTGGSASFTITATGVLSPRDSPADFTIAEIQTWVDDHPDDADEVLAAEQARGASARVTLVDWLQGFISHRDEGHIPVDEATDEPAE